MNDTLMLSCDGCLMRASHHCDDCLVTALAGGPRVTVDRPTLRAVEALQAAHLAPPLRKVLAR